jgi:ribonuclease Z
MKKQTLALLGVTAVAVAVGIVIGTIINPTAFAAGGKVPGPNTVAPDRYVYYPGTEELAPDEVRLIACGTGMPAARRGQAATCFLAELGNGDKFFFDIGTGSMANVAALMIPYDYLDKVFLTHLHTDHWGDLAVLWAGGWTAGRRNPVQVWGPSGAREDMGTAYAVEHLLKGYNWDKVTRAANLSPRAGEIEAHEFDYKGANQVVYENNGVVIRSWPAVHTADGSVSYSLEWNGYKLVFGGDTFPNKWYIKYAVDADLAIHESFQMPEQLVKFYNQPPNVALNIGTQAHTSPQAFGKVMSTIKPRHAVGYHFFNEEGTRFAVYEGVRETYDGPLSLAADNMVWNIRRDEITERMAVSTDEAWSVPAMEPQPPGGTGEKVFTPFILEGRWDVSDAQGDLVKGFAKEYDIDMSKMRK